jgi:hypothetical protein
MSETAEQRVMDRTVGALFPAEILMLLFWSPRPEWFWTPSKMSPDKYEEPFPRVYMQQETKADQSPSSKTEVKNPSTYV